jgi:hypothetical protein
MTRASDFSAYLHHVYLSLRPIAVSSTFVTEVKKGFWPLPSSGAAVSWLAGCEVF